MSTQLRDDQGVFNTMTCLLGEPPKSWFKLWVCSSLWLGKPHDGKGELSHIDYLGSCPGLNILLHGMTKEGFT